MSSLGDCCRAAQIVAPDGCLVLLRPGAAPQRVAEADYRDAISGRPGTGRRHPRQGENHAENPADCQESGRPACEDECPEERDAEDKATSQVCVTSQLDHGLQRPNVTLDGSTAVSTTMTSLTWPGLAVAISGNTQAAV
jgi:hypothetical protein